jgi:hypothetical protein
MDSKKRFRIHQGSSEKSYFLQAEVFFLLTRPLMGDPLPEGKIAGRIRDSIDFALQN